MKKILLGKIVKANKKMVSSSIILGVSGLLTMIGGILGIISFFA